MGSGSVEGGCNTCVKYMLVVFNIIFCVSQYLAKKTMSRQKLYLAIVGVDPQHKHKKGHEVLRYCSSTTVSVLADKYCCTLHSHEYTR